MIDDPKCVDESGDDLVSRSPPHLYSFLPHLPFSHPFRLSDDNDRQLYAFIDNCILHFTTNFFSQFFYIFSVLHKG